MNVALTPHVSASDDGNALALLIGGARCGGCLAKIETGLRAHPDVKTARMNLSTSRLLLEWTGAPDRAEEFGHDLEEMGFSVAPFDVDVADSEELAQSRRLLLAMAVAGFGLMNVMMLSVAVWSGEADMSAGTRSALHWLSAAIALPVAAWSGQTFFRSAWGALRQGQTNMDVPISLAIFLACGLSVWETAAGQAHTYFDAVLMLIFLLLIGRFLDARLRARTGLAARQLAALQARDARRLLPDGASETVPVSEIVSGDHVLIALGETIPADGILLSERTELDTSLATGETALQTVRAGEPVLSGTINRGVAITVEVSRRTDQSFLASITRMVEAGQQSASRHILLADRAARAYVPIVHSLAAATLIGWLVVGAEPRTAIINAIAVLIITCPCALGLAVPAVQVTAVGRLFSKGVLVRSGDALERLAGITRTVFDKTGTLTHGATRADMSAFTQRERDMIAAAARHSNHPSARLFHDIADGACDVRDVVETPSEGMRAIVDGTVVRIGQARYIAPELADTSGVWVVIGATVPRRIDLFDPARAEAGTVVDALRAEDFDISLLSGDAEAPVAGVAAELGITDAQARVRPEGKLRAITDWQQGGERVLMVGDGINDAPALAHADASVSLATGSDIARSCADVVLQGNTLAGLPFTLDVARQARRRVLENFGLAVVYNMLAVPLAMFGFVTPLIAALAMSGSSLLVTLNALRMRRAGGFAGQDHPGMDAQP